MKQWYVFELGHHILHKSCSLRAQLLFFWLHTENFLGTFFCVFQRLIGTSIVSPYHSDKTVRLIDHPAIPGRNGLLVVDSCKLCGDNDVIVSFLIVFSVGVYGLLHVGEYQDQQNVFFRMAMLENPDRIGTE